MKKLFSLLLVTLMLLSPFAMCVNAESVTEQAVQVKDTNEQKITSDLQAHLDTVDDDEYVPVYVWLNDYGEDMLYEVLSQRLGKTVTADTEESYIQDKIAVKEKLLSKGLENLAKTSEYKLQSMSQGKIDIRNLTGNTFKAQANLSSIMTDEEIDTCIESNMTSSEIIELSERNQFLSDYRQARKTVNTAVNTTFYNSLDLDECRNVYLDPLLCRVTMECKKSYVDDIEKFSVVSQVGVCKEIELVEENVEFVQIENDGKIDFARDTVPPVPDRFNIPLDPVEGIDYNGAGVRIGVIEVNDFDENSPFFVGKTIHRLSDPASQTTDHATSVIAILIGNPLIYHNGQVHQGIAPNATVFYIDSSELWNTETNELSSSVFESLLINENCNIINMSLGVDAEGKYTDRENFVDLLVSDYKVVIVKSAGNHSTSQSGGVISRPGMGYNIITVGNASYVSLTNDMYNMHYTSSYVEDCTADGSRYLVNKPDLSAFGGGFYMTDRENNVWYQGTGTSYATSMVSGTVALMMQANPDLIGKPEVVKNLLLLSADEEAIYYSETENELVSADPTVMDTKISDVSTILREKSGAGLLNISAAIRLAEAELYYDLLFVSNQEQFETNRYYFAANSIIEFGIVFEKATNEVLSSEYSYNYDIQILNSNNVIILSSRNTINNVEQFSCKIKSAGYYKFRITSSIATNHTENTRLSFALACGCVDKNIAVLCEDIYHQFVCTTDGCITIKEPHTTMDLYPNSLSDGSNLLFTIYYLFDRGNVEREFECYKPIAWIGSGPNMVQCNTMEYDWEITYTVNGETRKVVYAAIVEDNGVQSLVVLPEITIEIDYISHTLNAYWSP